jgi:hypothetical protein
MKITTTQLRRIIREEAQKALGEADVAPPVDPRISREAKHYWDLYTTTTDAPKVFSLPGLEEAFMQAYAEKAERGDVRSEAIFSIMMHAIDAVL